MQMFPKALRPPSFRRPHFFTCGCLLTCGALLAGCGEKLPPGMVRVHGVITFADEKLPEGTVNLERIDGSGSASGRIEPEGRFTVVSSPGEYKVGVISKEGWDRVDELGKVIVAKRRIPKRYESIATSGLKVTVTPRGDRLTIHLEP